MRTERRARIRKQTERDKRTDKKARIREQTERAELRKKARADSKDWVRVGSKDSENRQ